MNQDEIPISGGGTANKQGRILESTVVPTFQSRGFEVVSYNKWEKAREGYGEELLLKHVPYTTIYGHRGYTEFLVRSRRYNLEVRIECKWQQSPGSVDEKFPYLYLNCLEAMPEQNIVIVIGGGGYKLGSIQWLKNAIETKLYAPETIQYKNISVFSLDEFIRWTNRVFK
ncbi:MULTISPECIES: PD-(D/E)XK nuclease superfamily protein [Trichocoleus]|uniref:PD-(D/E)XK nuclease domain-containing protein n=1 Tax=Trichocoleus desertorum GB2-A4 TaxID=2933944 RepID=A0ABV0JEB0_9CYAN|nr:PD-(D/E)XK nuclease superfamily protein [Trichocoleus sp. FACHB-46]MBD1862699.1 4-diphosphocytidyl-2C-methyl-D-erythritol kinase [Trichocoleus sp. FACHB-46]